MAKKILCDDCGKEICYRDMEDGRFSDIVNYHPATMHLSTIEIIFHKDVSMKCNNPDLCRKCMIKHILVALGSKG